MNADDRRDLVSGFAAVLEDTLSTDLLLEASLDGGQPQTLRATMAEMGWFDLVLDESQDGLGLEVGDLAALSLVTGYHLLPIPLLIESFIVAPVLAAAGPTSAGGLAALRSGTAGGGGAIVAPALDAGGVPTVDGVVVALAPDAKQAVVLGRGGAVVVDLANADVERLEGTDLMSGQSRLQGLPDEVVEGVELVLRNWIVCALADCIGSAQAALDLALDYAKEREQFGSPIAKFQAISHMLADMRVNIELSLSSLARLVHLAESNSPAFGNYLVSMTHAIPQRARAVCEDAIQVHGGMGFTWEAGIHLFYRRVLQTQAALGGSTATARHAGRVLVESV